MVTDSYEGAITAHWDWVLGVNILHAVESSHITSSFSLFESLISTIPSKWE